MVSTTSARPSGARPDVPAKMTSSDLAPCSPITQLSASTTLDLPEPLGPTTQVMPGSKLSVVAEANDLNPRKVRLFRYNSGLSIAISPEGAPAGRRLQSNGRNLAHRPYAPRFGIENYGAGV